MASIESGTLPYRPCVGIMLFDSEGRVLMARRIGDDAEPWQMPQGGIDEGESPREAAERELEEEIGTDRAEIVGETRDWLAYDLPADAMGTAWGGRYRGQKQKWFAMRFTGTESDIDPAGVAHPEFDAWRWVDLDEVADLIVPFKRPVYEAVVAEFRALAEDAGAGRATPRTAGEKRQKS